MYKLIDADSSGNVTVDEYFRFLSNIGIDHEKFDWYVRDKYGSQINFYNFLAMFDFNDDTILKYTWNNSTQKYQKELNKNNKLMYHLIRSKKIEDAGKKID